MDFSSIQDVDRYELVKDIGSGNFGVARLMRDKKTRELVAVKYIERGEKVSAAVNVFRNSSVSCYCGPPSVFSLLSWSVFVRVEYQAFQGR
jgi:hypothetical protein